MSLVTNLQNLTTRLATEAKSLRTLINGNQAGLTALTTTAKSDLVAAINEVKATVDGIGTGGGEVVPASETVAGIVELATVAEVTTGVDTTRVVTPAGVKAATDALREAILGAGVPEALDTLDELAAALGDDANFAATVTTSLANKQPIDATLTALAGLVTQANDMILATGVDTFAAFATGTVGRNILADETAADVRTEISVYSQAEIGNPETDFVAVFEAGLA